MNPMQLAEQLSNRNLINGQSMPALSGRTFDVIDPATMRVIGSAPFSEAADVDVAVNAAEAARAGWAGTPATERGRMISECGRILDAHSEEMANLITLETGKAIRTESRVEAQLLREVFEFHGGLGSELKGETIPYKAGMIPMTIREPLGVVGRNHSMERADLPHGTQDLPCTCRGQYDRSQIGRGSAVVHSSGR